MKVSGPTGPSTSPSQRPTRTGGGFSLPASSASAAPSTATATSSVSSLTGVSALMALQGVEDPTERRRRAILRGRGILDQLEDLKMALLEGRDGAAALQQLNQAVREECPQVDSDPGLKFVLDQIELRAAVELAKAEASRSRV